MNVCLLAAGSLGDILPYLSIARELVERGHNVRMATALLYRERVLATGSSHYSIGHPDPQKVWKDISAERPSRNPFRMISHIYRHNGGGREDLMQILSACRNADMIVATTGIACAIHVARFFGVPKILCHLSPLYETSEFPRPIGPSWCHTTPLGSWWNRFTHSATSQLFWMADRPGINSWLQDELKLDPIPLWRQQTDVPMLFGFSSLIIPKPLDWPKSNHITGYWFSNESDPWKPPARLEQFLDTNDPIIAVALGSQVVDPVFRDQVLVKGILQSGAKVVVTRGWSGSGILDEKRVCEVDFVPYRWLFPKLTAVMHHGGAGTGAEAIRAGVPSILIPFTGEQRFWAQRYYEAGLGTFPLHPYRFSANQVASRTQSVFRNESLTAKAVMTGSQIDQEHGVDNAASLIEHYASYASNDFHRN